MMYSAPRGVDPTAPQEISIRCPKCRHNGVFRMRDDIKDISWNEPPVLYPNAPPMPNAVGPIYKAGMRICPSIACNAILYVVSHNGKAISTYPHETIDFDPSNLPATILSALEEAVTAASVGCFRASALMLRRVLEELCEEQELSGKDLNARLLALAQGSLLPKELIEAAHELRLLGNDAAHIISKNYNDISHEEITASIELTKEILKAVYQYTSLVERLKRLKKPNNSQAE